MSAEEEFTADEVAAKFRCSARLVKKHAAKNHIGLNLKGNAGWRFTEAEIRALREAMKPPAPVQRQRRRRVA